jgi:hypothetical protein
MDVEGTPYSNAVNLNEQSSSEQQATTAFRAAEKHYQLKREQVWRRKGGRLKGVGLSNLPTNFSGVLDLELALPSTSRSVGELRGWGDALHVDDVLPTTDSVARVAKTCGLEAHQSVQGLDCSLTVFSFRLFPGLFVVPRALSEVQQENLLRECLAVIPEPPSRSNHSLHLGALPGLWAAARAGLSLRKREPEGTEQKLQQPQEENSGGRRESGWCCSCGGLSKPSLGCCQRCFDATWSASGEGQSAARCLDRLRWVTVGPQFHWTPVRAIYSLHALGCFLFCWRSGSFSI